MHPILALAALCLLAACTPMQWQDRRFGTVASAAEVQECERSAYFEAKNQAFFHSFAWPRTYFGRDGRVYYRRWPDYHDTFFLERQLFDYCMRARGFQLVPVPPADAS
jgi:hypothetical protein